MTVTACAGALLACLWRTALADTLVLPRSLTRDRPASVTYRLDRPLTGKGVLDVEWTDVYQRRVQHLAVPVQLDGGAALTFSLDLRRAVAMANHLRARLTLTPGARGGGGQGSAAADFIARPPAPAWSDYQIIMWQEQDGGQWATLKAMGVTAGKTYTNRADDGAGMLDPERMAPLLQNDLRWFVENIAVDFYSAYHRWFPDRPKNWRFQEAKARYRADPSDKAAFIREPSLSDPRWLAKIRARLARTVGAYAPYQPLYYNLGDETGIADLAAFWDFDLSDYSLTAMRTWLRGEYGTLAALNREWGSDFAAWDAVMPATTAAIMRRSDGNFAAWADFKAWMDVAFARALRAGTDAVHAVDRDAYAAIEGAQVPGWGGYDYALLAHAVDLMEPYDFGNNVAIARSLNPRLVILTTSSGPEQAREEWRMLLEGARGLILWDPDQAVVDAAGRPGPWGRAAAARWREFRGGLGSLLINSPRHTDPVAMLYSPASMRTQWMLDQQPRGDAWVARDAEREYEPNALRTAVAAYSRALVHSGLEPAFVTAEQIARGKLQSGGFKALILPHAIALSRGAAAAIRDFVAAGGVVVADVAPGVFDRHSRKLAEPLLSGLFRDGPAGDGARAIYLAPDPSRPDGRDPVFLGRLRRVLGQAGIAPGFALRGPGGEAVSDVAIHVFRNGAATIIGLQRDARPAPAVAAAEAAGGEGREIVLTLARPGFVYDLRRRRQLGRMARVPIRLGDLEPAILAVSPDPLPPPLIAGPGRLRGGDIAGLDISCPAAAADARRAIHVEVSDPSGKLVPYYTANVVAPGGRAHVALPFALDAAAGTWTVRITDVLTGERAAATLDLATP